MSYQLEEVRLSQQIFYHLLTHRELSEHQDKVLYYAYTSNFRRFPPQDMPALPQ